MVEIKQRNTTLMEIAACNYNLASDTSARVNILNVLTILDDKK